MGERKSSDKKRSKRTKTEMDVGWGDEGRERFSTGVGRVKYDEGRGEEVREGAFKKKGKVFDGDNVEHGK